MGAEAECIKGCGILRSLQELILLYLGGQGDLVNRLLMGISRVTIWLIGVINLLTKSPDPPSILECPEFLIVPRQVSLSDSILQLCTEDMFVNRFGL